MYVMLSYVRKKNIDNKRKSAALLSKNVQKYFPENLRFVLH